MNKNFSIQSKLIAVFAGFVVLALILASVGVYGLNRAQQISDGIHAEQIQPMETITAIVEDILVASSCFDMAILAGEPAEVAEYRGQVEQINQEIPELINTYEGFIASDDEQAAFDTAVEIYETVFVPKSPEVFALLAQGKVAEADDVMGSIDAKIGEMLELFEQCRTFTSEKNEAFRTEDHDTMGALKTTLIIISGAILLLVIVLCLILPKSITKPLIVLQNTAKYVKDTGNLNLPPDIEAEAEKMKGRRDEVGDSLRAFLSMLAMFQSRAEMLNQIADGNLTGSVELRSNLDTMGISLQKMLGSLNDLLMQITQASGQVTMGARQVATGSQTLAHNSTDQASVVAQMQSVVGNITDETQKNADMSREAATLGDRIRTDAESGSMQMENMVRAVEEISEASQNINRVIKVIDDIAFQTNILALNAAVEAARAGQQGKGFAVVADEVRNLASKSADAAKETSDMITTSMEKASVGSKIALETAESLRSIVSGINRSSEIITEIAASSAGQQQTIGEINRGIGNISAAVQASAAAAEESAASAEEMSGQAELLNGMVSRFRLAGR